MAETFLQAMNWPYGNTPRTLAELAPLGARFGLDEAALLAELERGLTAPGRLRTQRRHGRWTTCINPAGQE